MVKNLVRLWTPDMAGESTRMSTNDLVFVVEKGGKIRIVMEISSL
jgi:hypothetical protein